MRTLLFASFRRRLGAAVAGVGIVLSLFVGAAPAAEQVVGTQSERFSELLGRPFSEKWKEPSAGWTDMHYAALLDLPEVVAALTDAGMAVDVRLKGGDAGGDAPFGDDLKRTLASLGHAEFEWGNNGETPLMIASITGGRKAAAELIARGADVHTVDDLGSPPLGFAAYGGSVETVKVLLAAGADANATDKFGETPLHGAAEGGSVETVKVLLSAGANVSATDNDGETPLHSAAAYGGSVETVKFLLSAGADVSATDNFGLTPLHSAAYGGSVETVKFLLSAGADVNATDNDGETPLDEALSEDHVRIQEFLRRHGGKCAKRC